MYPLTLGNNTSTLKNHLNTCDNKLWVQVVAEDKKRDQTQKELKQVNTYNRFLSRKQRKQKRKRSGEVVKYGVDEERQKHINRALAIYVAGTNIANSVVDNSLFTSLITLLEPRYNIPGCSALSREIDVVFSDMKVKVKCNLMGARKINFCADVWSKKGLTSSYLGVTAHYYSPGDCSIRHAALAVRTLPYPHTGLFTYLH